MTSEQDNELSASIANNLAEQDSLKTKFETAFSADSIKDDIDLEKTYADVTEFRQTRNEFLIKHTPTTIFASWSSMTGPRALKRNVVGWVDEIHSVYPPKAEVGVE